MGNNKNKLQAVRCIAFIAPYRAKHDTKDMPMKHSKTFNLNFSNIPLINIRQEFEAYYERLHLADFQDQLTNNNRTIETPILTWRFLKMSLLLIFYKDLF